MTTHAPRGDLPTRAARSAAARAGVRVTWMDTLRGAAIMALLMWHASSLPTRYGFEMPQWLFLLNEVLLPWRMPTLMFLSGLLLSRSVRKPLRQYYSGKLRNIVWPYVLWAALYLGFFSGPSEPIDSPVSWFGAGYLWFLFYLALYYAVAPLVVRAPWWVVLPAVTVGALVISSPAAHKILYFAIFFFGGHFAAGGAGRIVAMRRVLFLILVVVAASFTTVSLVLSATTRSHFFQFEVVVLPFVFALIAVGIRCAVWVDELATVPAARLSWVGRRSVVFYLSHVPVMHVVCLAAIALAPDLTLWIVPVCFVAALGVGIALASFKDVAPVSWLFTAPRFRRRSRGAITPQRRDAPPVA